MKMIGYTGHSKRTITLSDTFPNSTVSNVSCTNFEILSAAASYMHPLEFVLTDSVPKSAAPLLLGSHPVTLWLWHFLANLYTVNSHSGYHLPFLPSNENHDYHHYR